jgi:hypothetical protein
MRAPIGLVNLILFLVTGFTLLFHSEARAGSNCEICGKDLGLQVYLTTDEITLAKREVCSFCTHQMPSCFLCSIPVSTNAPGYKEFADGRVLCKRDSTTAVAGAEEGERVIGEVRDWMIREFSRFMEFSETNSTVKLVDRPTLETLFKFPGRDLTCPDIWGTTQRLTNNGTVYYEVGLLEGLPRALLRHTVAHELAHVWLHENVPDERYRRLDRDANEGFCELMAWFVDETCSDADLKAYLRRNLYTRGQIEVFLDVYQRFGLNDIVEWLKYGIDKRLVPDQVAQINKVVLPAKTNGVAGSATNAVLSFAPPPPKPAYSAIFLQGITWSEKRPLALINGNTFAVNEEGKVKVAGTNLTLRCLAIQRTSVRVSVGGVVQELKLPER